MLIVTEKPSVGRDIAQALGAPITQHDGYLTVGADTITWGFGHLVTLASPEVYQPSWQRWTLDTLPMLPDAFALEPVPKTIKQLRLIAKLMRSADLILSATDADREGELIFRYIYEWAAVTVPVKRLWLSENTVAAIRTALTTAKPLAHYNALAEAAKARSQADWLVGLNATRAFTLRHGQRGQGALSVGRVQTPTLRLIVDRDLAILHFTPTPYWQFVVTFRTKESEYLGVWFRSEGQETQDRFNSREDADKIAEKIHPDDTGVIVSIEKKRVTIHPPLLFSLNDLQKEGNRRFGLTAQQTLDVAQTLYEKHLISYPRTDARHVTHAIAASFGSRLKAILASDAYQGLTASLPSPLVVKRLVDETKVAAAGHYAIIPTGTLPKGLPDRESKIFDLIARRLIASLMPPGMDERVTVITKVDTEQFQTRGTTVIEAGWRMALKALPEDKDRDDSDPKSHGAAKIPPGLKKNQTVHVANGDVQRKETKAPPALNDASLLALMEKHGLGTPATRSRIVEVLLARDYVERLKKTLVSTEKGRSLLALVPEDIQNPDMTGTWESRLEAIAQGREDATAFLHDIRRYTSQIVDAAKQQKAQVIASDLGLCPLCKVGQVIAGKKGYGCSRWREGCSFTIWRQLAGKKLSETQVKTLLAGKTTGILKGFKSKAGKSFSAKLHLDPATGKVEFIFSTPEKSRKTSSAQRSL